MRSGLVVLATLCVALGSSVGRADPTIFPTGVTIHEDGVEEGLLLYGAPDGIIRLFDMNGTEVHVLHLPCGHQGPTVPLDNGHILTKSCDALVEVDWDGNVFWELPPAEGVSFHHEWVRLDSGNTLILADLRDLEDLAISDELVRGDFLIEVEPDGTVVWEWHLNEHFDQLNLSQDQIDAIRVRGGDWSHANTASVIPPNDLNDPVFTPGNIIMSLRHTNTVLVVDRSTGDIVWVMTGQTVGQHNPHIIPLGFSGAGNMLIFDNGYSADWAVRPNRSFSLVKEINPVTREPVWIYDANMSGFQNYMFFSDRVSNNQRLAGGNTLIVEGNKGRVFEVDPEGAILWEFVNPYISPNPNRFNIRLIYRAYKVPFAWAASSGLEPDLAVSAAASAMTIPGGDSLRYTIGLQNLGISPALDAQLTQTLSPETTFEGIEAPAAWGCTTPAVGETGTITCLSTGLLGGEAVAFDVDVRVNLCAGDQTISYVASATSSGSELTPPDNSAQIDVLTTTFQCPEASPCTVSTCDPAVQECVETPVVCEPLSDCHVAGACNPDTGQCTSIRKEEGSACNDEDPTTCGDVCSLGGCVGTFTEAPAPVGPTVIVSHDAGISTIEWTATPGPFNVYRGLIGVAAGFEYNHECMTPSGTIAETSMVDAEDPSAGTVAYYLVTRVELCRDSVTGFDSENAPRPDVAQCPSGDA